MNRKLLIICSIVAMTFSTLSYAQLGPNDDLDGDGIINSLDIDDDNDGVLDSAENANCYSVCKATAATNSGFVSRALWSSADNATVTAVDTDPIVSASNFNILTTGGLFPNTPTSTQPSTVGPYALPATAVISSPTVSAVKEKFRIIAYISIPKCVTTDTSLPFRVQNSAFGLFQSYFYNTTLAADGMKVVTPEVYIGALPDIVNSNAVVYNYGNNGKADFIEFAVVSLVVDQSAQAFVRYQYSLDGGTTFINIPSQYVSNGVPNSSASYTTAVQQTNGSYTDGTTTYTAAQLSSSAGATSITGGCPFDTDNDGIPNNLDLDSDGDGCPDSVEAGVVTYINSVGGVTSSGTMQNGANTGTVTSSVTNATAVAGPGSSTPSAYGANGFYGSLESNDSSTASYLGTYTYNNAINSAANSCTDTDGDSVPDYVDLDDDNDGILDTAERNCKVERPALVYRTPITGYTQNLQSGTLSFGPESNNGSAATTYYTAVTPTNYFSTSSSLLSYEGNFNYIATPNINTDFIDITGTFSYGRNDIKIQLSDIDVREGFEIRAYRNGVQVYPTSVTLGSPTLYTELIPNVSYVTNLVAGEDQNVAANMVEMSYEGVTIDKLYIKLFSRIAGVHGILLKLTACDIDTDQDGIPNHLDLDSDNDGCPDAIEGGGAVQLSNLTVAGSGLQGGNGVDPSGTTPTGTYNQSVLLNLCADSSCVNISGLPQLTGITNYSNTTGQTVGTSTNANAKDAACEILIANNDSGYSNFGDGYTSVSLLTNDNLNGVFGPTTSQVTISQVGTWPAGFTLNANGTVTVAANTPTGSYNMVYQICVIASSGTNCTTAIYYHSIAVAGDQDGDGVLDANDLDNDNDGILDTVECSGTINLITNGDFSVNSNYPFWTVSNPVGGAAVENTDYIINPTSTFLANVSASVVKNGFYFLTDGSRITRNISGVTGGVSSPMVLRELFYTSWPTARAELRLYYDNVHYLTLESPAGNNGFATVIVFNGATTNVTPPLFAQTSNGTWTSENKDLELYLPTSVANAGQLRIDYVVTNTGGSGVDKWGLREIELFGCQDFDGDGIPDFLDTDSDNDGCPDAVEGGDKVTKSMLNDFSSLPMVYPAGSINTLGNGTTNIAQPITTGATDYVAQVGASGTTSSGVPVIVNPDAANTTSPNVNTDGLIGQTRGESIDATKSSQCEEGCYKPDASSGVGLPTNHGITLLNRAGVDNENWPMVRTGAWTALESKTKGFVINRVPFTADQKPIGFDPSKAVQGMMVYDTTFHCLRIYVNATLGWKCFDKQTCPDP